MGAYRHLTRDDRDEIAILKAAGWSQRRIAEAIGNAGNRARYLQSLPANVATPEYLAGRAREIGGKFDSLEVEVLDLRSLLPLDEAAILATARKTGKVIVLHQDGRVTENPQLALRPGDEIMVLPKIETKRVEVTRGITQILYQIAVAARVLLSL